MMRLERGQYGPALALFRNSRHQMKLQALREGGIEAAVWADGPEPAVTAVLYCNKLLLASTQPQEELAELLRPFLMEQVYARRMGCRAGEALIMWDGENVGAALQEALADKCPAYAVREYYELDDQARCRPAPLPEGYALLPVDAALLAAGYGRTDALREEMCSERATVEDFLAASFGVAVLYEGTLVGWCLSEYNCAEGCEVGIEVEGAHRRRGLAAAMVSALAAGAARRNLQRIGWHCFRSNKASAATARTAGFAKKLEYGQLFCFFTPTLQYAVNGNVRDDEGEYAEALIWYDRAAAEQDAPLWAHVRRAMACASLGQVDAAFAALRFGIDRGLDYWGWIENEPRLKDLRDDGRWQSLHS